LGGNGGDEEDAVGIHIAMVKIERCEVCATHHKC
jgi:hypothetical protein